MPTYKVPMREEESQHTLRFQLSLLRRTPTQYPRPQPTHASVPQCILTSSLASSRVKVLSLSTCGWVQGREELRVEEGTCKHKLMTG